MGTGAYTEIDVGVGIDGEVWTVDTTGKSHHRTGVTDFNLAGTGWEDVDSNFVHIDVGDCQVCGITPNHEVMCRENVDTANNGKKGEGWQQIRGQLSDVSVGYGPVLWGVDYGHNVWFK